MTNERGIPTGAHFIIGFPGEPRNDFVNDIDIISSLKLESIKFHQLQIIKFLFINTIGPCAYDQPYYALA
jgi:radical SAM superfamily enzyme